jgi:hypothetical protein
MLEPVFKVMGLLEVLTPDDIQRMAPVSRRRFADQCRRMSQIAEPCQPEPRAGVLLDLKRYGTRAEC